MRVEVDHDKGEVEYPCLMISESTHVIVLFLSRERGTVVSSKTSTYEIGYASSTWNMKGFQPFHGSITLTEE